MKIDREMRFPHPVLWSETSDYSHGAFSMEISVAESIATGKLELNCEVALSEAGIYKLCVAAKASVGLSVACLETYYNRLHEVSLTGGSVAIGPGLVRGAVIVRPMIWAREPVAELESTAVHDEFGSGAISFPHAAVLALGEEVVIDVGAEKLAPIGSVFALALDQDVPEHEIATDVEDEKIQIRASGKTLEWLSQMRGVPVGRATLLSAVYLPVVIRVLDVIRQGDAVHQSKRWHRVFCAKLVATGLWPLGEDLLEIAQKLLKSPLGKLEALGEIGK